MSSNIPVPIVREFFTDEGYLFCQKERAAAEEEAKEARKKAERAAEEAAKAAQEKALKDAEKARKMAETAATREKTRQEAEIARSNAAQWYGPHSTPAICDDLDFNLSLAHSMTGGENFFNVIIHQCAYLLICLCRIGRLALLQN